MHGLLAADWQLGVSIDKCCVMCIGKGEITDQFHIDGIQLNFLLCLHVAIWVLQSETTFDHVTDIVVRAHRRANLIHRCFISRNVTLLVRAFLTYVRPLLE